MEQQSDRLVEVTDLKVREVESGNVPTTPYTEPSFLTQDWKSTRSQRILRKKRPDQAQSIFDSILGRITTLKENPDILMQNLDLAALTSDPEDYDWQDLDDENGLSSFAPLDEAARQINEDLEEMQEEVCSKELKIKELEEMLAKERFQLRSASQRHRLEIEQLHISEKMQKQLTESLEAKLSTKEAALLKEEENIQKTKALNVNLQEKVQKLQLWKQSQEERLRIMKQDKLHIETVCKSTTETMQIELDALRDKLKVQIGNYHREEEVANELRSKLKNKALDVDWLTSEKTNMKTMIEELQQKLQSKKLGEEEFAQLSEENRKLRIEVAEYGNTNETMKKKLKMEEKRVLEMEKRINELESVHVSDEDRAQSNRESNLESKYKSMDQQLRIERLETQVANLKEELNSSGELVKDLRGRLQTAKELLLKNRLEKDESIMTIRRQQSTIQFAVEKDKNSILKESERKLQQAEAKNSLLETKHTALCTQLSVLEKAKAKTLDIQTETISSLERMVKETQKKLTKANESYRTQRGLAEEFRSDNVRLAEEKLGLKMRLKVLEEDVEQKMSTQKEMNLMEERLRELSTQKTWWELEKSQLEIQLQSMKEQITLVQEQRVQSIAIQKQTIVQLEKQEKATRKQNEFLEECKQKLEAKLRKRDIEAIRMESSLNEDTKILLNDTRHESTAKENALKIELQKYKEMLESEKQLNLGFSDIVDDLKRRNIEGAKALRSLMREKNEVEVKLRRMDILREHMYKVQQNIVGVLERELVQCEKRLEQNQIHRTECTKVESEIQKLSRRLSIERKTLRKLDSQHIAMSSSCDEEVKQTPRPRRESSSNDYDHRVKELRRRLIVSNEVEKFEETFQWIKNQQWNENPALRGRIKELHDRINQLSTKIATARNDAEIKLQKYDTMRQKLDRKYKAIKDSTPSRTTTPRLKSRLKGAIGKLKHRLDEKSGKLNEKTISKLSGELVGLQRKMKEVEMKCKQRKSLKTQLTRVDNTIKKLENWSEKALKSQLRLTSIILNSETFLKSSVDEWQAPSVPMVHGYDQSQSSKSQISRSRTLCHYCGAKNIIDYSGGYNFQVNCWKCGREFAVDCNQNSSPRQVVPEYWAACGRTQSTSQRSEVSVGDGGKCPEVWQKPCYGRVRITGLQTTMIPQLISVVCNIVFYGFQINKQEQTENGELEVDLESPITQKQFDDMQSTMRSLKEAMRKKKDYDGDIDNAVLHGVALGDKGEQSGGPNLLAGQSQEHQEISKSERYKNRTVNSDSKNSELSSFI